MQKNLLPLDIQKRISKQLGTRITVSLAILLAEAGLFYFAGGYLMDGFGIPNTVAIFTILTAITIGKTGLPKWLLDRPWQGRITQVSVETVVTVDNSQGRHASLRKKNRIHLIIERENGKLMDKNLPNNGRQYLVGDQILHFRGLIHPLVLREGRNADGVCLFCGMKNPDRTHCAHCGHTIIKP